MSGNAAAEIAVAPALPKGGSGTAPPKSKKDLRFRSFRKRLPFSVYDENDVETQYVLYEVDGQGRTDIINLMRAVAEFKVDENNRPRIMSTTEIANTNVKVIQFCLQDMQGQKVDDSVVSRWPGTTQHELAQEVMILCGLAPESGEDEKKS